MPVEIGRHEVERLLADGARLVEVLSASAYEEGHLPGAINLPLAELDRDATADFPQDAPIIVYCADYQ